MGRVSEELKEIPKRLEPDRKGFEADPIGYSALAWHKWGLAQTIAGFPIDLSRLPSTEDLNSPVLWLVHAHALAEAARYVVLNEPDTSLLPTGLSGVCDSQYCAVGLMLVAYSLEASLKAMLVMKTGVTRYIAEERAYRHHHLPELATFVPDLDAKDRAILQALTHFSTWAGRYPDPGSGRRKYAQEVVDLAEQHQVTAKDLFFLAARVMGYAKQLAGEL
jgi:hypothetical protein